MQYTISINQVALISLANEKNIKVGLKHGAILNFLILFAHSPETKKVLKDQKIYTYIAYSKIISEMPLLEISNTQVIARYLTDLKALGIIDSYVDKADGNKVYFTFADGYNRITSKEHPLSTQKLNPINSKVEPYQLSSQEPINSKVDTLSTKKSTYKSTSNQSTKDKSIETHATSYHGLDITALRLTEQEAQKLYDVYRDASIPEVEKADLWMASKGTASKYKSHYAFLRNWMIRAQIPKHSEASPPPQDYRSVEYTENNPEWDGTVDFDKILQNT